MYSAEFPAVLESVHGARNAFAGMAEGWSLDESTRALADLTVSEFVTNALLHAGTPIRLRVSRLGGGVKVEVFDGDPRLPQVHAARPENLLDNRSMTGRGLALIASIADRWGADPVADGKVMWAELGTDRRFVVAEESTPPRTPAPDPALEPVALAGGGRRVRLVGMPVPLVAESARQLADLRREVQMMELAGSEPGDLGRVIQTGRPLVRDLDFWARSERRLAEYATARGEDTVDMVLTVPDDIVERLDRLAGWLRRCAAKLARGRMLTLPAGPEVDAYRSWYRDEILAQLDGRAPRPFPAGSVKAENIGGRLA